MIGVLEADVDGEVLALLSALAELVDPSAKLSREASVGFDVDGAGSIAELLGVIPHAEGVVVATSASCFRKLTGLNAAVERSLEAGFVVDADFGWENGALLLALSELDVPLALGGVAVELVEGS